MSSVRPAAAPSDSPPLDASDWQKASILGGVLSAFRIVRKEADVHNSMVAPKARPLPAPITRDQSILRIQAYVRGRKTRKRARATLQQAKQRAATAGTSPSEHLHAHFGEPGAPASGNDLEEEGVDSTITAGALERNSAVVVTISEEEPAAEAEGGLAEKTRVPYARAPRLAPKPPRGKQEPAADAEGGLEEKTRVPHARAPRLAPKPARAMVRDSGTDDAHAAAVDEQNGGRCLALGLGSVALGCLALVVVLFVLFFTRREALMS